MALIVQEHELEEVKLCRLRIGHTLATHRYLLCNDPKPSCSRCGDFLSVLHMLVSCTDLAPIKVRYFGARALTLKDLLEDTSTYISVVFKYLAHIKFMYSNLFTEGVAFLRFRHRNSLKS